jgi:nucleotide-binding universal stress UspA family protein
MKKVLACIDRSSYAPGVCDHAAWLADSIDATVLVLHVEKAEPPQPLPAGWLAGDALVAEAVERLRDSGVVRVEGQTANGDLVETASAFGADFVVMGKRGSESQDDRQALGHFVEAMVRGVDTPVCVTSKVHLPVRRALALMDADLSHRRSIELMRAHPGLRDLESDLVVVADPAAAAPKLAWARANLPSSDDEAFALPASDLAAGLARYMLDHTVDLIMIARDVLLSEPTLSLQRMEAESLWAWRTPVLIC